MLVERIRRGDYARGPLPSTRKLGAEFGVSKFTILRAFQQAQKEGLLALRGRNRIAGGKTSRAKRGPRFACVVPAVDLASSFHWFLSIDNVASEQKGSATLVDYRSVTDPRLTQALGGKFDVIFLDPPHGELTPLVKRLLSEKRDRVIPLYEDLPELDLWGIDNMPVSAADLLIFHLASLGHREIHLVGSLPLAGRQQQLLDRWRSRLQAIGATGESYFPTDQGSFLPASAMSVTRSLLASDPRPQSVLFADLPAAIGGYRALWELGLAPGKDVSVAALTCEPEAALMTPSLTSLVVPSRESIIREAIEAISNGTLRARRNWDETVLPRVRVMHGESSAPQKTR